MYKLSVVEFINRMHPQEPLFGIECNSVFELEDDDEQVYSRTQPLKESSSSIDFGWVENPGMVHIENRSKHELKVTGFFKLPPGASMRVWSNGESIPIEKDTDEDCKILVHVFPR